MIYDGDNLEGVRIWWGQGKSQEFERKKSLGNWKMLIKI